MSIKLSPEELERICGDGEKYRRHVIRLLERLEEGGEKIMKTLSDLNDVIASVKAKVDAIPAPDFQPQVDSVTAIGEALDTKFPPPAAAPGGGA